jgi:hypothetical protein
MIIEAGRGIKSQHCQSIEILLRVDGCRTPCYTVLVRLTTFVPFNVLYPTFPFSVRPQYPIDPHAILVGGYAKPRKIYARR